LLVGTLGLFNNNINVLVPLFAKNVLNVGPQGYGLLMAMMGAGSLGGALVAAFSQRPRWRVLTAGAAIFFLMQLGFAFSRIYLLSLLFMAASGFAIILFYTSANTGVQTRVPDLLRGRVMGVYMAVNVGTSPLGNLTVGWLAHRYGAPAALTIGSALALAVVIVAVAWLLPRRDRPSLVLDRPEDVVQRQPASGQYAEAAG
jgi:MFS family permease